MKQKVSKRLVLFIMCAVCCLVFCACKHDSIKFNRESKVTEMMNKLQPGSNDKKNVYKKSSGVIIYRDNSSSSRGSSMNFGPRDVNFDMPIIFK